MARGLNGTEAFFQGIESVEYMGHTWCPVTKRRRVVGRKPVHAYTVWLRGGLGALGDILPLVQAGVVCPECRVTWPMAREGGIVKTLIGSPDAVHRRISDSCKSCGSALIIDCTTQEQRRTFKWVDMYQKHPRYVGDRLVRFPRVW